MTPQGFSPRAASRARYAFSIVVLFALMSGALPRKTISVNARQQTPAHTGATPVPPTAVDDAGDARAVRALHAVSLSRAAHARRATAGQYSIAAGGVRPLGAGVWSSNGPEGGVLFALVIDPSNPQVLYAGGFFGGGIYKTADGGASWTQLKNGLPSLYQVHALAIDPSSPQTVYAAAARGGVYKTTDGGATWLAVNNGLPNIRYFTITVDPNNSQTVYAGALEPGSTATGVYKTTNGGASWSLTNSGLPTSPRIRAFAVDKSNSQNLYAAVDSNGIYKSSNGGASWSAVNTGLPSNAFFTSLAIDPNNTQTVYAGVFGSVYKSSNGGASWTQTGGGLPSGFAIISLAIDASNSQIVYAGTQGAGVYKSSNGGVSWTLLNPSGFDRVEIYSINISPNDSQTIYVASTFGIYKTTDGGASGDAFNHGILDTFVSAIVVNPTNGIKYASVYGSGVYASHDGGASWFFSGFGLGRYYVLSLVIDPTNPNVLYAGTDNGVYKSTDGAFSWNLIGAGLSTTSGANFINALAIDPRNTQNLYAGTNNGIYKITGGGTSFAAVNTGIPNNNGVFSIVGSLAVDPLNSQTVYAGVGNGFFSGSSGGTVYKTTNGGASWNAVSVGLPSVLFIYSIQVDPTNTGTIYIGTFGGVYKTTDGGASWTQTSFGLPANGTEFSLAIDPNNPRIVYAGTGTSGVYRTTDGGASWNPFGSGLPTTIIDALLVDRTSGKFFAGLFNGGVWDFQALTALTISGRITTPSGAPASGIVVNLTGTQTRTTTTDSSGNYSFTNLPNGNYTVTPQSPQLTIIVFTPSSTDFKDLASNQIANFVATSAPYSISGRITDLQTGAPLKNIQVNLSGAETKSVRTDANGAYSFSGLIAGGNFTVKPFDVNLSFSPASQPFNNLQANGAQNFAATIINNPLPPQLPQDDFSGSQRDATKFQLGILTQPAGAFDPAVTTAQTNGQLVITPIPNANGLHYGGYTSTDTFDFSGGTARLEVVQAAQGGAETVFAVGSDADNFFRFVAGQAGAGGTTSVLRREQQDGGLSPIREIAADAPATQLVFQVKQSGQLQTFAVAYDPVQMRFWQMRHDQTITQTQPAGAIVFETSPNNLTFTERFRAPVSPKTVNAVALEISAGTSTATTNPGQAIVDNLVLSANSIDSASFLVSQHYRDFLSRPPDISGLQFWTNEVFSCGADAKCIDIKRQNVSAAYFLSREFQETGFYAITLQRAAFGRVSQDAAKRISYSQFTTDAKTVGQGFIDGQAGAGAILEQNKTAYAQAVAASAAFVQKYPTSLSAAQFVDALYQTAGVAAQGTERQEAITAFGSGDTAGRAAALRKVAESNSIKNAEFSPAFVLLQYFGYLRRNPTDAPDNSDAGYQFWLQKLNSFNGDYISSQMVRSFIVSAEYRKRFGSQ